MKKQLIALGLMLGVTLGVSMPVMATTIDIGGGQSANIGMDGESICDKADLDPLEYEAAGCNSKDVNSGDVAISIINWVIMTLGVVAVLFVIIGGAQYMTSQGDPTKTKRGKDTILYAILGVVLAALAFTIVNFVIANIIK